MRTSVAVADLVFGDRAPAAGRFDQAGLLLVKRQLKLRHPFLESGQHPSRIICQLKGHQELSGLRGMSPPRPSRPEDLHPEPLTDSGHKPLDLSGSCHPLKAAAFHRDRRVPPVSPLTLLIATRVTCSLRSSGITPFPRYYRAVRPWVTHRYFRTRGSSTCAFSLSIASQVLKFRTKARTRFTPPLHRTPHSQ